MMASLKPNDSSLENDYEALKKKGRELAKEGLLKEALHILTKAYTLKQTEKLRRHIENIKHLLDERSIEKVEIAEGFYMSVDMYDKLYPYQREAVLWMWSLFRKGRGGVLGDDMGLGKTIQIISFLSSMLEEDHIRTALLIMPPSLICNWMKEFDKWAPDVVVMEYHSNSKKDRERSLHRVQRSGGILLTTYGMVANNFEVLQINNGQHFVWDYIVLDEGHKIRNPTKSTKAVNSLDANHRLVLTGTPIQNNLQELWQLYNFVHKGNLLGSLQTFKMLYQTPIIRSREKDATQADKLLGSRIAENLRTIIAPYFLRRTKQEVLHFKEGEEQKENDQASAYYRLKKDMMIRKNEFVVWVYLSPAQITIYEEFLQSQKVKDILVSGITRSPLVELTTLKKICDHPRLLSHRACLQLGLEENMTEQEIEEALEKEEARYFDISNTADKTLIEESGKMGVVFDLLENLRAEGHRVLLFSQSCRILDIIQKVLGNRGWKLLRLDGKIRKTVDRDKIITAFQNDSSYPLLLLTTQVGGVGLTLTAADRVIIYDPSWNPATDAQAVDRAYRIGQTRSVVVYRLVTCGSVEEKIYRRQIFKDSIMQQTAGSTRDPHRYFTKGELWDLFIMDNPKNSQTQQQLESLHSGQRKTDDALDMHIVFLYSLNIFGISDHDLMFKGLAEEDLDEEANRSFVREKVEKAQRLIALESDLPRKETVLKERLDRTVNPIIDRHQTVYEIPVVALSDDELGNAGANKKPLKKENPPQIDDSIMEISGSKSDFAKKQDLDSDEEFQHSPFDICNRNGMKAERKDCSSTEPCESDDETQDEALKDKLSSKKPLKKENPAQNDDSIMDVSGSKSDFAGKLDLDSDVEFQLSPFDNGNGIKSGPKDCSSTEPCESDDELQVEELKNKLLNLSVDGRIPSGAATVEREARCEPSIMQDNDIKETTSYEVSVQPSQPTESSDRNGKLPDGDSQANACLFEDGTGTSTEPCADTTDDDSFLVSSFSTNNNSKRKVNKKRRHQKAQEKVAVCSDSDSEAESFVSLQGSVNRRNSSKTSPQLETGDGSFVHNQKTIQGSRLMNSPRALQSNKRTSLLPGHNFHAADPSIPGSLGRRKSVRRSHVLVIGTSEESEASDGFYSIATGGASAVNDSEMSVCQETSAEIQHDSTDFEVNAAEEICNLTSNLQPLQSSSPFPKRSFIVSSKDDSLSSSLEDIRPSIRRKAQVIDSDSDTD